MLGGGGLTLALLLDLVQLPAGLAGLGFDPVCYGMALSAAVYVSVSLVSRSPSPGDSHGTARI